MTANTDFYWQLNKKLSGFLKNETIINNKKKSRVTSDVNGFQSEGLFFIVNQSGLLCLVSHCRQRLCWA